VADVEEDFGRGLGLQDLFERSGVVRVRGGESGFAESVDVDEVDFVAWFDEDGDQGESAVAGEVGAFEVDEEGWLGAGAGLWEGVEERGEGGCGGDHFGFHGCRL